MKPHQVNLEELRKWQEEEKVLFANSTKEKKSLYATLRGSYEVYHNGVRVLESMQAISAVEKYNSLL